MLGLSCFPVVPPGLSAHKFVGPPTLPVATHPSPPAATLAGVLSAQLPISTPPTGLNECFFFNSLVVRLPYSSIFWQFWLFFVFKFVVFLHLVVQEGEVYLPMPPSWLKSQNYLIYRCSEIRTFIHFCWECKMVQPLWKSSTVPQKVKHRIII